jgi:hypothetical protein
MDQKRASTWASSSSNSIGCVQNDFLAYGMFGATGASVLHLHKHCLETDRNKIPDDPHHVGVPSGLSKIISETMIWSTQTVHQSSIKIVSISKRNEIRFYMTHDT